jgi:hypothetical protein
MPSATPVTTEPEIVQIVGVREVNVTGKPELATASTVPVPPGVIVGANTKVIV